MNQLLTASKDLNSDAEIPDENIHYPATDEELDDEKVMHRGRRRQAPGRPSSRRSQRHSLVPSQIQEVPTQDKNATLKETSCITTVSVTRAEEYGSVV